MTITKLIWQDLLSASKQMYTILGQNVKGLRQKINCQRAPSKCDSRRNDKESLTWHTWCP